MTHHALQHFLQATSIQATPSAYLYLAQLADDANEALQHFSSALKLLEAQLQGLQGTVSSATSTGKQKEWSEEEAECRRAASRALVGMTELYLTDLWCGILPLFTSDANYEEQL